MSPEGYYAGTIVGPWWLRWLGHFWHGKRFQGRSVLNHIGDHFAIPGTVSDPVLGVFVITYSHGLKDTLMHVVDDKYYGEMHLGPLKVRFHLEGERRVAAYGNCDMGGDVPGGGAA